MARRHMSADSVAEAFLALLAARGVDYLFANPGTDFPSIIEALAKGAPSPRAVPVAHENVAMAMAYGHAMVSGRPQAVMAHVNVGLANTLCGLFNASRGRVPMLLCAGRTPLTERGAFGSRSRPIHWAQEMFDQAALVREHVRWSFELQHPSQLETVVDRALALAQGDPAGPVYLSLPREVLAQPVGDLRCDATASQMPVRLEPPPQAIAQAASWLAAAERPVIVTADCGGGPQPEAAVAALSDLVDRFALPLVACFPRFASLPTDHPMHFGFEPGPLLADADLVLALDCDVPWIPSLEGPPEDARVIHIASDPLYRDYPLRGFRCDLPIACPSDRALPALASALLPHEAEARARIERRRAALSACRDAKRPAPAAGSASDPPSQADIARCLNALRPDDAIVVNEMGIAAAELAVRRPGTFFAPSPAGGLGWGLGAALGAKLAVPDRMVIATLGDGSYMFGNPTPAHLAARSLGLAILVVVSDNGGWNAVRRATRAMYPDGHATHAAEMPLTGWGEAPAYEAVAAAGGAVGMRVDCLGELEPILREAMRTVQEEDRMVLVSVRCRP